MAGIIILLFYTMNNHDEAIDNQELIDNKISNLLSYTYSQELEIQNLTVGISYLETQIKNTNKHVNNLDTSCEFEITDLMFIEEARERFDEERNWSTSYDCSSFTNDFTDLMNEFNIEMFAISSFETDNNIGHKYNCIPFDAQHGFYDGAYDWDEYTLAKRLQGFSK